MLSQYDAWYQQSVQQWCELPGFQAYWEKARKVTRQEIAPTKVVLARMATTGEVLPIRLRHMLVSVSGKISPAVSAVRNGEVMVIPTLALSHTCMLQSGTSIHDHFPLWL